MTITTMLVDDHVAMRQGLAALLEKRTNITVICQASTGLEAIEYAVRQRPQVIILDVAMPDMNGIEAARRILEAYPEGRVLALSMHAEKQFVSEMFAAGASGYMLKNAPIDTLVEAIEKVKAGQVCLAPELVDTVVRDYAELAAGTRQGSEEVLTPREREIVKLIAEGDSTRDIADKLAISVSTVNTHRQQILKKLNLKNAVELTRYAIREGLTRL